MQVWGLISAEGLKAIKFSVDNHNVNFTVYHPLGVRIKITTVTPEALLLNWELVT